MKIQVDNENSILDRVESVCVNMACLALIVLVALTVCDVLGRNFMNSPVPGTTELSEICLAVVVFLGFPGLALRKAHIMVDLLDCLTSERWKRGQVMLGAVLGFLAFTGLAYSMTDLLLQAYYSDDVTLQLQIPLAAVLFVLSVLCVMTAISFLGSLRRVKDQEVSSC